MVFPEGTGDPQWLFGVERRNLLMARLQTAWGAQPGRHFLPLIHTRPLLGPADRIAARGRTVLKSTIDAAATQVRVADGIRVPDTPCWAWIEGELVLVLDSNLDTLSGESTLEVVRGPNGEHQDVWARGHAAGAPVTFTKVDDVFIHAKLVLIDDVFASIGSVNMNRRSMYHDGEISAQVVPGRLRAAVDNPVRSLRCRIWADHLGLAVDAAESELADPLAALELFPRPRAAGNPLVPFALLDNMQPAGPGVETRYRVPGARHDLQPAWPRSAATSGATHSAARSSTRRLRSTRSTTPRRSADGRRSPPPCFDLAGAAERAGPRVPLAPRPHPLGARRLRRGGRGEDRRAPAEGARASRTWCPRSAAAPTACSAVSLTADVHVDLSKDVTGPLGRGSPQPARLHVAAR